MRGRSPSGMAEIEQGGFSFGTAYYDLSNNRQRLKRAAAHGQYRVAETMCVLASGSFSFAFGPVYGHGVAAARDLETTFCAAVAIAGEPAFGVAVWLNHGVDFGVYARSVHCAPPSVFSMPAFKILSAAAKIRCALRSGIVEP